MKHSQPPMYSRLVSQLIPLCDSFQAPCQTIPFQNEVLTFCLLYTENLTYLGGCNT